MTLFFLRHLWSNNWSIISFRINVRIYLRISLKSTWWQLGQNGSKIVFSENFKRPIWSKKIMNFDYQHKVCEKNVFQNEILGYWVISYNFEL